MTEEEKVERRHMLDLMDTSMAELATLHEESCSTEDDYPGWTPAMGCCGADAILRKARQDVYDVRRIAVWLVISVCSWMSCTWFAIQDTVYGPTWSAAMFWSLTVAGVFAIRWNYQDYRRTVARVSGKGKHRG